jgi:hypothetical protein
MFGMKTQNDLIIAGVLLKHFDNDQFTFLLSCLYVSARKQVVASARQLKGGAGTLMARILFGVCPCRLIEVV